MLKRRNYLQRILADNGNAVIGAWLFVVLFFAVVIVFPLLYTATVVKPHDFIEIFANPRRQVTIFNTFILCALSTALSVLAGYIYAYAVIRGNIPFKKVFEIVPLIQLATPPFVGGLAFILLAGRQGFITHTLLRLDISLYGLPGLVIAQVFSFFPIAYLICRQSLCGINPSLIQAARSMGASASYEFLTITLPLSFPGILASLFYIAISVLSDFGTPLLIAGRFHVLAVEVYTQLTGWINAGASIVVGLIILFPSCLLLAVHNMLFNKNAKITATTGDVQDGLALVKGSASTRFILFSFCALLSLGILAQFAAIIAGSFQKLWGINTELTLVHIKKIPRWLTHFQNSFALAAAASGMSAALAALTAYLAHRTNVPCRRFLDAAAQIPVAIPNPLMGLIFSLTANRFRLDSSRILIIIVMAVTFLPFSYRIMTTTYARLKSSLDNSARSLGASQMQVFRTITLPLSLSGFFSSLMYTFVRSLSAVSAVIFLVSFGTPLISISILNLAENGDWGQAAALSLALTALAFAVLGASNALIEKFTGAKLYKATAVHFRH